MLCRTKAGGRRRHGSVHPSTQRGESPVAPWLSNEKQPRQLLSLCRRVSSFVYWIKKNSMLRCSLSSILWWFIKFFRFDFVLENSSDGRGLDSSFGWVETSISVAIDNKPSPYWRDGFLPDISSSPPINLKISIKRSERISYFWKKRRNVVLELLMANRKRKSYEAIFKNVYWTDDMRFVVEGSFYESSVVIFQTYLEFYFY